MRRYRLEVFVSAVLALTLASPSSALTKFGELSEYYIDYADVKQGATISSPCKVDQAAPVLESIITPSYDGTFIFADGIEQREEFTIDLGRERKVGRFIFEMTQSTVYGGELKRKPNSLTVEISTVSANGPWTRVYKLDPADVIMSFALENVPARWIRFDLGVNKDGVGSRVRKAKICKRYQLASGPELMKEFHTQFRRDAEGLGDFWKAVDAGKWEEACERIIEHYAKWPPEAKGTVSPRVQRWMANTVEQGGAVYKFESSDWDWLRMKAEASNGAIGELPDASSILYLLKNAYTATGDEAYAKQLSLLLKDWLQDSPCPGVHREKDGRIVNPWAGIVASQRAWSFGEIVHAMFKENKCFDRDLKINLLYSFWEHINFLRSIFHDMGGNWLTNANSCMFQGAKDYPEFVQYKEWLETSKSFFETSLTRDFFPSGKEREDSCMYAPFATGQANGQYVAMHKAGIVISPEAQQRVERMWDCLAWVRYPDLSIPAVGDCHRESPLARAPGAVPEDYLAIFDRPDLVYINSQGKEGRMPSLSSRAVSDGGWYVMRSAWDTNPYADARQMFFKASKHQGHGHQNQLSVTMYAYGREILTDPGQPMYGIPIAADVRPTARHNTICVDGRDQDDASGTEHAWVASKGVDFVDAECAPYKGLVHRRQIVFLKSGQGAPDYWLIRDAVTGEGEHKYDMNYHFSEDAKPQVLNGSVCTTYSEGGNALIRCLDQSVKPEIVEGHISLLRELVPSEICRFSRRGTAPARFDTLIVPFKGPNSPRVKAGCLRPDPSCVEAGAICVRVDHGSGSDFVVISSVPGTALSFDNGRVKTDAAIAVIRTDKKGAIVHAFRDRGYTAYKGKPM